MAENFDVDEDAKNKYGGWNLSYKRLKFSIYTCTCINDDVITQYNPNPNPNHKKILNVGPETLTLILMM